MVNVVVEGRSLKHGMQCWSRNCAWDQSRWCCASSSCVVESDSKVSKLSATLATLPQPQRHASHPTPHPGRRQMYPCRIHRCPTLDAKINTGEGADGRAVPETSIDRFRSRVPLLRDAVHVVLVRGNKRLTALAANIARPLLRTRRRHGRSPARRWQEEIGLETSRFFPFERVGGANLKFRSCLVCMGRSCTLIHPSMRSSLLRPLRKS